MSKVMWKVTDKTTSDEFKKRTQVVMLDGVETPFEFSFGKPTLMPPEAAMKFAPIVEGFDVIDENGKPVKPSNAALKPAAEVLGDSEVVADLSELTNEALAMRASPKKGGEKFSKDKNPDRLEMIEFLTKSSKLKEAKPTVADDDELPKSVVDDIFAGA